MQSIKIANLKNNLSRHLARVRRGGQITVLDRETPVARIVPFVHGESGPGAPDRPADAAARRLADLVRRGVVSPGDPQAVARWVETHAPRPRPAGSPSAVEVLLQARRESTR